MLSMGVGFNFGGEENWEEEINCVPAVKEAVEEGSQLAFNVVLVSAEHDDLVEVTMNETCRNAWSMT